MSKKSIYLCGPMSAFPRGGKKWRSDVEKFLVARGEEVFNPCTMELTRGSKYGIKNTSTGKWSDLPQPLQEDIVITDLNQVAYYTKYIVCCYPSKMMTAYELFSQGTASELGTAIQFKVPVYMVLDGPIEYWAKTAVERDGSKVFSNFKQLRSHLVYKYKYRVVPKAVKK